MIYHFTLTYQRGKKNHRITSFDVQKALDKIIFHDKSTQQSMNRGEYPQHNEGHL
jgi:hypothetical protein